MRTYQEQRVGQESVEEHAPANPPTGTLATVQNLGHSDSDDDTDKLVTGVSDQIVKLRIVRDAQQVAAQLETEDLCHDYYQGCRRRVSEKFWLKLPAETSKECREKDVRHDSHNGNVHIGAVDVVSRREVPSLLSARPDGLLARPWLVPPREEDENYFVDDVGIGNVEVVLQGVDVNVSVELQEGLASEKT